MLPPVTAKKFYNIVAQLVPAVIWPGTSQLPKDPGLKVPEHFFRGNITYNRDSP